MLFTKAAGVSTSVVPKEMSVYEIALQLRLCVTVTTETIDSK